MKQFLLGILIGFLLNSSLRTYYSYIWWNEEAKLTAEEFNASWDKYKSLKIVNDRLGLKDNLKYLLIYYQYPWQKWELSY